MINPLELACTLAGEFASRAAAADHNGRLPPEDIQSLKASGYLGLNIPRAFGGHGLGMQACVLGQLELARSSASTAMVAAMQLQVFGDELAARNWPQAHFEALCRRTRQIVAFVIGDRSAETCRILWERIPAEYKLCHTFSDFWEAYAQVFPKETHRNVGKESCETSHVERWNDTCRQSNARYVRKTLSFSKSDFYHELVTRLYIVRYNIKLSLAI